MKHCVTLHPLLLADDAMINFPVLFGIGGPVEVDPNPEDPGSFPVPGTGNLFLAEDSDDKNPNDKNLNGKKLAEV